MFDANLTLTVSGSRHGHSSPAQQRAFHRLLRVLRGMGYANLRHGACLGIDESAALLGRSLAMRVIAHPCTLSSWVSQAAIEASDEVMPPGEPLARNVAMVRQCDAVVAVPREMTEQRKGGTWHAVKQARLQGRPLWICWADGSLTKERWQDG